MTVLNQIEILETNNWLIAILVVLAFGGFFTIMSSLSSDSSVGVAVGIIIFVVAALGAISCTVVESAADVNIFELSTGKYQYEVTVQPEAWAEVLEDYKIVDQRGKIYILEKKDDVE